MEVSRYNQDTIDYNVGYSHTMDKLMAQSKREKVFNLISKLIDLTQDNWKVYTGSIVGLTSLGLYIYVVFFWLDTVESIDLVITYF